MTRASARSVTQVCPNCALIHDVAVYVSGQRVLCRCGIRFEVKRQDVARGEASDNESFVHPIRFQVTPVPIELLPVLDGAESGSNAGSADAQAESMEGAASGPVAKVISPGVAFGSTGERSAAIDSRWNPGGLEGEVAPEALMATVIASGSATPRIDEGSTSDVGAGMAAEAPVAAGPVNAAPVNAAQVNAAQVNAAQVNAAQVNAAQVNAPKPSDAFARTAISSGASAQPVSGAPIQLSGYTLHDLLGRGGMGEVWRATQISLGRPVAVKLLPPKHAADPEFVARFEKEATALASLNHPHIIQIIDRGLEAQHYYFVMEFVEGRSLRERMQSGTLTWIDSLKIALQVARAIESAHDTQIIHRDLKPENILLDARGHVKVADFGLAGIHGSEPHLQLTGTAVAMGTLNYMAPEQRRDARSVDGRADIYSLGVMIYEMLTGELPIGRFRMPTERLRGIDPRVDEIIAQALEPDPDARYPSIRPLCETIEAILASVSTQVSGSGSRKTPLPLNGGEPRPRSRGRRTWSNLRTGFAVVGGLAVLSFLIQWGFGTTFSLHVDGKDGNGVIIGSAGVTKVAPNGEPPQPKTDPPPAIAWPPNSNDEYFVSALVEKAGKGSREALVLDFAEGDEEVNVHEGNWRLEGGMLVAIQAGSETKRDKLVPRAYVAHRYFSVDDFDAQVTMDVQELGAAYPLEENGQRFGELAMRINELQVSVFAIPGVGMRLLWRYFTPEGVEIVGNSARDVDNLIEDETPVPRQRPFAVRLKLQRVKDGVEIAAFVNNRRFARKVLRGLEGQVGKVAVGCRNLRCSFDDLKITGMPAERPQRKPAPVARD